MTSNEITNQESENLTTAPIFHRIFWVMAI